MDALNKLYIEITTACNLDCQMCVRRTWNGQKAALTVTGDSASAYRPVPTSETVPTGHMPTSTFANLMEHVSQLSAPPIIHLGGYGEPTCHPDFPELLRLAKAAGATVEMTTNGTLLTRELAKTMVDLPVDRVTVSMDGVSSELYEEIRQPAGLSPVIENLLQLHRYRLRRSGRHGKPRLALAFVAMKKNLHELPELTYLASRVGAWEILVSNVIPHTPEMEQQILYKEALRACAFRASRWVPEMSLPKLDLDDVSVSTVQRVFNSRFSISLLDASLSGRNDYCRFAQEGYAAIRWDGQVSPCLSLLHDHPEYIRGRRKDVTHYGLGNVNNTPLAAIWESPEFTEFRARLRAFHFSPCTTCGGCERFPYNYDDCTGNTFPTCGGCLWAQGFIQCP